jgi:choline kinase
LEDAETLRTKGNRLIEIGEKIKKIKDVQGQFMGIFFIPKNKRKLIMNIIENNSLKKKQITFFMNYLLKKKIIINTVKYMEDWYEFDDYQDLLEYNKFIIND